MAIRINSNVQSLTAQRQVAQTGESLSRVFEQLSSGQRINHASDDAAGLAISQSLKSNAVVFTQATRNVNDGISFLSVADAALNNLGQILGRQSELAEQAANGSYSTSQKAALQKEADALGKEYTRILTSSQFNGIDIFSPQSSGVVVQSGYGSDQSTSITTSNEISAAAGNGEYTATSSNPAVGANNTVGSDMNGDGFIDQVIFNASGITTRFGDGTGNFGSAPTSTQSVSLQGNGIVADFDKDGIPDVLIHQSSDTAVLYHNQGNGSFLATQTFSIQASATNVLARDFDNDGYLDVAVSSSSASTVTIHKGSASGFQSATTAISLTGASGLLEATDFNNDGILDLVTKSSAGLATYLGRGNNTFGPANNFGVAAANQAAFSDFDKDGKMDIAVSLGTSVVVGLGDGSGSFSSWSTAFTSGSPITTLYQADMTNDGNSDLVASHVFDYALISLSNGDGTFQTVVTKQFGAPQPVGGNIDVVDLNKDGVLDILTGSANGTYATFNLLQNTTKVISQKSVNLFTAEGARSALDYFSETGRKISQQRAVIGASQSRLNTVFEGLSSKTQNLKTASSRIVDADVAQLSSQLLKERIREEVSTSVLAQANLQPGIALKLLRG